MKARETLERCWPYEGVAVVVDVAVSWAVKWGGSKVVAMCVVEQC